MLAKYRHLLESRLGRSLESGSWEALEEASVVCGALMLLWAKASAVKGNRPDAKEEWAWWKERLDAWAERVT